jgi:cytochrome c oxidase cbb3-type subunit III
MSVGRILIAMVVLVALSAGATGWLLTSGKQARNRVNVAYPEGIGAIIPLGLSAGGAPNRNASIANPLAGDPNAIAEGKKLFVSLNCAGCHGYKAHGNMGPDLTAKAWRYGGTPIDVYKSIYEGRPKGMPAWGNALPPNSIWQLVAYIQSLGGTLAAPSTGQSQQAGGHWSAP